jgi:hypothetical protein
MYFWVKFYARLVYRASCCALLDCLMPNIHSIERGWGGMDWIYLAQNRDQWTALVNTVMNLRVP